MRGRRQRPKERSKRLADLSIPKEEALEPEIREVKKEKPEASIEAYLARIDLKRNPEIKKFDQGEFFLRLGKLNWNELNISEKIIALNESGFSGNTIKRILLEEGKNEGSLYSSLAMLGYSVTYDGKKDNYIISQTPSFFEDPSNKVLLNRRKRENK